MNQSLISLSHSHHQARNIGYSWRVLDILASSSLLICEKSTLLSEKFGKNIKKQFYSSAYDVRKKCDYFLKNKNARSDLIAEQNEIIDKFYRWGDRIKKIEDIFGLKTEKNKESSIIIFRNKNKNIKPDLFLSCIRKTSSFISKNLSFIKYFFIKYFSIKYFFLRLFFKFLKKKNFKIYKLIARYRYFYNLYNRGLK
jgi:hypothetical protein